MNFVQLHLTLYITNSEIRTYSQNGLRKKWFHYWCFSWIEGKTIIFLCVFYMETWLWYVYFSMNFYVLRVMGKDSSKEQ